MGEPVKIIDLARQLVRLAGMTPGEDIEIRITGFRPGERLHETLLHDDETLLPTTVKGILLAAPRTADLVLLSRGLDELSALAGARRNGETVDLLHRLGPEFRAVADDPTAQAAWSG